MTSAKSWRPRTSRTYSPARGASSPRCARCTLFDRFWTTRGCRGGPTGSVGFELATELPTATPVSDLDLLVRIPRGSSGVLTLLAALHREFRSLAVRVDCQIETLSGAVALAELVGGQSDVMVRTDAGPRLVPRAVAVS